MEYIVKDIIEYEKAHDISIVNELCNISICTLVDMIKIGHKCEYDEACEILQSYFDNFGIEDTIINICSDVIGDIPNIDNKTNETICHVSLCDILEDTYFDIKYVHNSISFSEYINMSTRQVWRYLSSLRDTVIDDLNDKANDDFRLAATISGVMIGKMKHPLKINKDSHGGLTNDELKSKLISYGHHVF